jgi:putative tricarboxylic transport membrane protein
LIENILQALGAFIHLKYFFIVSLGTFLGIILGAIPGIGASTALALFLPFTFGLDAQMSVLALISIYGGAEYGGSITAISINTPGTGGAVATCLDGYPLTKKGLMGQALSMSLFASVIGGIISALFLLTLAPILADIGLKFGPPETFAMAAFGLTIIASLSTGNILKGFLSAGLGLLAATIGIDPISGFPRFVFGFSPLTSGIAMIPVMIGLFALAEAFRMLENPWESKAQDKLEVKNTLRIFLNTLATIRNKFAMAKCIIRSSLIGVMVGIIPGAGTSIAAFISYNEERRASKYPEQFGTGILEGVAAPEAANNAVVGGALVTTLALGIPGSASCAILLGTLMMNDFIPGPLLFERNPDLTYLLMTGFLASNFFLLLIGLLLFRSILQIIKVKKDILACLLITICLVGTYAYKNSETDMLVMFIFGIVGWFLEKIKIQMSPFILAFILGEMLESNLLSSLLIGQGSYLIFVKKPIALALIILAILSTIFTLLKGRKSISRLGSS